MKRLLPLAALILAGCVSITTENDSGDDRDDDREQPVASVPAKVLSAARDRIPGFTLTEAVRRENAGVSVYELEGVARGQNYELDVTPGGRVLRVDR